MEKLVDLGLTKSIGVSNFNVQLLWDMLTYCRIKPVVNEVELHPYLVQDSLVKFMKQYEIVPIAYCPVARGMEGKTNKGQPVGENLFANQTITSLMDKYQKTGAQIMLNWGLQRGHILIPKSNSTERQQENIDCLTFNLTTEEVDSISTMNCGARLSDGTNHFPGGNIFA